MNRPLRVGVDAGNLLVDRRGIGRYARSLLRRFAAMPKRTELFLLVPHMIPAFAHGRLKQIIGADTFHTAGRSSARRLHLDLVWYPWNGMIWVAPNRRVATVHDVWPFASPAPDPRIRRNEQLPFRTTAARADRIVADSQFTKSEITKHLGVSSDRIDVVNLGVDPPHPHDPADRALPEGFPRYVLFVGEAEPRKDLPTLFAAMERLDPTIRRSTALVVAGRRGHWRNFGVPDDIQTFFVGEIGEARLAALYAGAAAFAFPSTYEGFGLPLLEAMSYGAPVVASDAASIPEAGGSAAAYFPAGDAQALTGQLTRVLTEPQFAQALREAGLKRAAEMSWERCADETLSVFERAAS